MTERNSSVVVEEKPEALLGALALPERDWDKIALAVEARLADTAAGSTDNALLRAPFPSEAGEPESAGVTPLAHSGVRTQSLAELARQSLSRGGESDASMAKTSLAFAARGRERAQTEELAEKMRQLAPPSAGSEAVDVSDAAVSEVEHAIPSAQAAQTAPAQLSGNQLGYWVGAGGAMLALAAALTLWLRPAPAPLIVTQVVEKQVPQGAPGPAAAPASEPAAVEPDALAREKAASLPSALAAAAPAAGLRALPGAPLGAPPGAASASPSASPAPDKIVLDEEPSAVAKAAPNAAPEQAPAAAPTPSSEPAMRPADSTATGALPERPSMGAVQSAMASVMSSARHCVAGESEASSALIVFSSDGHVSGVTVSGAAAGKPAAACIQTALSRAKTQPFAQTSFSFSATIRP